MRVVFVIRNNNKFIYISSGIKVKEQDFDPMKQFKGSALVTVYLYENAQLRKKLTDIETYSVGFLIANFIVAT
jgi:hypothetical protein